MNESQPQPSTPKTWQFASIVSTLGKWAWIFGLINGIINLIWGIWLISVEISLLPYYQALGIAPAYFGGVWAIIGAIILIFISFAIIRPKFSNKCADQDWEALYSWTLALGNTKIPWMLIWGIIFTIFSWYYWGGIFVLLPAILLIFMGPRTYNWS